MARDLHVDKLIINVDALEVINLLSNTKATNRITQPIVDYCRNIKLSRRSIAIERPIKPLTSLLN